MLTKKEFENLLLSRGTLIIDGALATELETRGHNLNHPLWSALILKNDPGSIQQVHLDYFLAGADVAITSTYQAAPKGLTEHFGMTEAESTDLIKLSVQLAQDARNEAYRQGADRNRTLLVAGSVGPFGAYLADGSEYRGDYVRTTEELKDFHRPRIQALIEAQVDLLALETIPSMIEIDALLDLLGSEFQDAVAWLSCTVSSPTVLSDGTPLTAVLQRVNISRSQIVGFGINCVPLSIALETLTHLQASTNLSLVCYPNSGETWDATTNTWQGHRPDEVLNNKEANAVAGHKLGSEFQAWTAAGAKLIGGCCRTGPAFIEAICGGLAHRHQN